MSEKRLETRTAFRASVRLTHAELGVFDVFTRDMSQTGIFLLFKEFPMFNAGDIVTIQSLDIDDAPVIQGEIVRVEASGVAIHYQSDE